MTRYLREQEPFLLSLFFENRDRKVIVRNNRRCSGRKSGNAEAIHRRRSREFGLARKPTAPNFPQRNFWTGITSG